MPKHAADRQKPGCDALDPPEESDLVSNTLVNAGVRLVSQNGTQRRVLLIARHDGEYDCGDGDRLDRLRAIELGWVWRARSRGTPTEFSGHWGIPSPAWRALLAAAAALDAGAATAAEWEDQRQKWNAAREQLRDDPAKFLLHGIPELPGLRALAERVRWDDAEGLGGSVEIGPLRLEFASMSLLIRPPAGVTGEPIVIGPFQPNSLRAAIRPPFGDGGGPRLPGGGEVVRLTTRAASAGACNSHSGPSPFNATAVLERLADGTPSFLAVIGVEFRRRSSSRSASRSTASAGSSASTAR